MPVEKIPDPLLFEILVMMQKGGTMQTLLTPEDSKRVADALIEKINDANVDLSGAVFDAFRAVLRPDRNGWHEDWFPLQIEDMCDKIANNVYAAVYQGTKDR